MKRLDGFYRFIGPGDGCGDRHIAFIFPDNEIVTISDNFSWLGPWAEFRKCFTRIPQPGKIFFRPLDNPDHLW